MNILLGIMIPFLGTMIGSFFVFFMRGNIKKSKEKMLLSFAACVMIAASVWSLLLPAIDMSEGYGRFAFFPAAFGFFLGVLFLFFINYATEKLEKSNKKTSKMIFAITLHNIPEGMAVGVCFAYFLATKDLVSLTSAFVFSLGIAIQNIPEGAIISMPLRSSGCSKLKAFIYGTLSGIVEPIFAFLTILLTGIVVPILPYLLSFASGAMVYVVCDELIPEGRDDYKYSPIFLALGFLVMMILDVCFG